METQESPWEQKESEQSQRKRTRPVSFRLPEGVIYELRKEASLNQEDLGSFGRSILSSYLDWGRHSDKVGLMPVSKEFVKDTLEYLPDEVVMRLASKAGRNAMVELTLSAEGNLTVEGFLSVFNRWLKACGMNFRFDRENGYNYAISPTLGKKWSVYLQSLVASMCEELPTKLHPSFESRGESLIIRLKAS